MPRRIAESATRLPTLPRPITPSVWPGSSKPANCFLPSSTRFSRLSGPRLRTKSSAGPRLRAAISMPASTSSFTALAFAPGALNTGTPRLESATTGMLLVPAPARPSAASEGPNSYLCRSCERTRIASGSPASFTTAYCSAGKRFSPTAAIWLMTRISRLCGFPLTMFLFELAHVVDQGTHALDRHRVVDRRAHPADRAVALELHHAALHRALEERLVELGVLQRERHVHARAVFLRHRVVEEPALVEVVVQQLRLLDIDLLDGGEAAELLQPLEHQPGDVHRVARRRVEHRVGIGLRLVVHHARRAFRDLPDQVVAHDDEGQPGRAGVLLR